MKKYIIQSASLRSPRGSDLVHIARALNPVSERVAVLRVSRQYQMGQPLENDWTVVDFECWAMETEADNYWLVWETLHFFVQNVYLVEANWEEARYFRFRDFRENSLALAEIHVFDSTFICLVTSDDVSFELPSQLSIKPHEFEI